MIPVAVLVFMVNCTEPRISFRDFYEMWHGPYPGAHGERLEIVNERVVQASGDYAVYSRAYAQKCGIK